MVHKVNMKGGEEEERRRRTEDEGGEAERVKEWEKEQLK